MKPFFPSLAIVFAAALLAGCPQSKVPDTPPMVPQPKAGLHVPGNDAVAHGSGQDPIPASQWRL